MKKCLVIDDDPLICDLIKHFCSKQDWISGCICVGDGSQALQATDAQDFDLIFLDYNLPDLKGKNLLELMPSKVPVIMVTSEQQFGAESYEFDQIVDFMVKPISYERFLKAIFRFKQLKKESAPIPAVKDQKSLLVKDGNTTVLVKLEDIQFIKSESNYVVFHLKEGKVMSLMSLKALENELPSAFARIHKSFIINFNYLQSISSESVQVASIEIPIGPKHKENLKKNLDHWNQSN